MTGRSAVNTPTSGVWPRACMLSLSNPNILLSRAVVIDKNKYRYKLIKLTEVDHDFYRGIRSNGEVLPQITTRRSPEYSSELRDLVHQCLKFDPKDRPSLAEVLKRIESERLKFFKPWSEGAQMEEEARVRVSNDELNAWTYGPWRNEEKMPLSDYLESDRLPGQTAFDQKGPQAG